jgi:hypothetical protein
MANFENFSKKPHQSIYSTLIPDLGYLIPDIVSRFLVLWKKGYAKVIMKLIFS